MSDFFNLPWILCIIHGKQHDFMIDFDFSASQTMADSSDTWFTFSLHRPSLDFSLRSGLPVDTAFYSKYGDKEAGSKMESCRATIT